MRTIRGFTRAPSRSAVGAMLVLACVGQAFANVVSVAPIPIDTIAYSGQSPPSAGGLVYGGLGTFSFPRLNSSGEVVFSARLSQSVSSGTFVRQGIWAGTPQTNRSVFMQGSTISSSTGPFVLSGEFSDPNINASGQVVSTCATAIIMSGVGPGQVVIKNGDPVPGSSGTVDTSGGGLFGFSQLPFVNDAGQISARIGVAGVPVDTNLRLLVGSPGALVPRLAKGPQPDLGAGVSIVSLSGFRLNNTGTAAGMVGISVNGGESANAIVRSDPSGSQVIATVGGQIAGQPTGATFVGFGPGIVGLNDQSQITLVARTSGLPGTTDAVFKYSGGTFSTIAARGQVAPDTADLRFGGTSFYTFSNPALNASGDVVFQAGLVTTSGQAAGWGIFAGNAGSLRLIAQSGGDAGFGETFADNSLTRTVVNNGLGEVAMLLPVGANKQALFATDEQSVLHRLLAVGDSLQVTPGVFKQVSLLRLQSIEGGAADPNTFNDLGQLAFFARFTDNTEGVFRVTVPAPTTLSIFGGLGMLASRRRSRPGTGPIAVGMARS